MNTTPLEPVISPVLNLNGSNGDDLQTEFDNAWHALAAARDCVLHIPLKCKYCKVSPTDKLHHLQQLKEVHDWVFVYAVRNHRQLYEQGKAEGPPAGESDNPHPNTTTLDEDFCDHWNLDNDTLLYIQEYLDTLTWAREAIAKITVHPRDFQMQPDGTWLQAKAQHNEALSRLDAVYDWISAMLAMVRFKRSARWSEEDLHGYTGIKYTLT